MLIGVNADGSKTLIPKNNGDCGDGLCNENEYSLLQYNFSFYFGIAIQLYEATLVSDDTPWDRFRREHPQAADPGTFRLAETATSLVYANIQLGGPALEAAGGKITIGRSMRDGTFALLLRDATRVTGSWTCG